MLSSLLYVSTSLLTPANAARENDDIVRVAIERNARLDVTGALVHTGANFAQVLEGERAAIDELMTSIMRDPRHRDVRIVAISPIELRRFPGWRMAYAGPSVYVENHVVPLLSSFNTPFETREHVERLITLMEQIVRVQHEAERAGG